MPRKNQEMTYIFFKKIIDRQAKNEMTFFSHLDQLMLFKKD